MVLTVQCRIDQVADDVCVLRNFDSERIFNRADGGQSVNAGAHTADAFHKGPSIAGIASFQNDF